MEFRRVAGVPRRELSAEATLSRAEARRTPRVRNGRSGGHGVEALADIHRCRAKSHVWYFARPRVGDRRRADVAKRKVAVQLDVGMLAARDRPPNPWALASQAVEGPRRSASWNLYAATRSAMASMIARLKAATPAVGSGSGSGSSPMQRRLRRASMVASTCSARAGTVASRGVANQPAESRIGDAHGPDAPYPAI